LKKDVIGEIIRNLQALGISDSIMEQIKHNHKLMRLSTYVTVAGVCFIIIAKLYGWFVTESVTMLASLVDSLFDVCVSMMNLLAVRYSLQPPDHEHRFGHGKAEDIAAFVQSVFFGLSGVIVVYAAAQRFFHPNEDIIKASLDGIGVMCFSVAITFIIVLFQRFVVKRTRSIAIEADSFHYLTDFFANIFAIIGMLLVYHYKTTIFDNIAAIIIAIYIIYTATKIFTKALNNLMDHELKEEDRQIIIDILNSYNKVKGFHDLKTRHAGTKIFIQFHLELDSEMLLKQAHLIAVEVENLILTKLPQAEIIIHLDPDGIDEEVSYKD